MQQEAAIAGKQSKEIEN